MKTKQNTNVEGESQFAEAVSKSEAFRETFVFFFDPEEADIVRKFGDVLQERLLDRGIFEERNPGNSYTLAEVFAAATDLWFLENFLRGVGEERSLSELTPTEQRLSSLAERYAQEIRALAAELEQDIQDLISDEDDGEPAE